MTQQLTPYKNIEKQVRSEATYSKLALVLGHDPKSEQAEADVKKYQASVLQTIQKTLGTDKDLSRKDPNSIVQCMIDAAQFRVMIDGRQHAHLVPFGNSVTLQMGYRGYLAKIKEFYPDADFTIEPVYKGDEYDVWHTDDGQQKYSYKKAKENVFADGEENFEGILFAVKYTDNGRLVQKVQAVAKTRIDRARKAAKQGYVWNSDYIEKAKAAAIKAACKHHFASLTLLQGMISYDNEKNYDPSAGQKDTASRSLLDNLNSGIESATTTHIKPDEDDIDADFSVEKESDNENDIEIL